MEEPSQVATGGPEAELNGGNSQSAYAEFARTPQAAQHPWKLDLRALGHSNSVRAEMRPGGGRFTSLSSSSFPSALHLAVEFHDCPEEAPQRLTKPPPSPRPSQPEGRAGRGRRPDIAGDRCFCCKGLQVQHVRAACDLQKHAEVAIANGFTIYAGTLAVGDDERGGGNDVKNLAAICHDARKSR